MPFILAPLPSEHVDDWRAWNDSLKNEKKGDFDDFNERHRLERHSVWLVQTPAGPAAAVLHEGPGADSFMQSLGSSDHEFDVWFRDSISKFHNIDFSKPPEGPMPELVLDVRP